MTHLQVIWQKGYVKFKEFPMSKAIKAFNLWYRKNDGQIVLRDTKDGYEPSFSNCHLSAHNTIYWDKSNYLRAFGEFLRDHKDSINWDNVPTKAGFTIWFMAKDQKDFRMSHFAWDHDKSQKKIFDSLEVAQQYANSQKSVFDLQPQIEEITTW